MQVSALRPFVLAAGLAAASLSAQALTLTIPTNFLVADSVQKFSAVAMDSFSVAGVQVIPLGNATAVAGTDDAFRLPITTITISNFKIAGGDAKGSALEISRIAPRGTPSVGKKVGITLANFTINYNTKQVLADITPLGGTTVRQAPLYNFNVATPLGLKYKFPLTVTGREVLDRLTLTQQTREAFISRLELKAFEIGALDTVDTFGTLTQEIFLQFRARPVSTTPYTPAP
ncbi:hypothetical protein GTZ97_15250 [Aquabacterium fontiphilum]|jgi:hypothetical protein|uniref:hypothetical protein n=1 Tax=Aquabacterium fontiphilum TaxID=450365 RepID=UPI001377F75E|nr:hypothetical protein [Aquabacterium fontiphilum]NBD22015.1 hypothetical protein [Aquabacterium fontiphilum]